MCVCERLSCRECAFPHMFCRRMLSLPCTCSPLVISFYYWWINSQGTRCGVRRKTGSNLFVLTRNISLFLSFFCCIRQKSCCGCCLRVEYITYIIYFWMQDNLVVSIVLRYCTMLGFFVPYVIINETGLSSHLQYV